MATSKTKAGRKLSSLHRTPTGTGAKGAAGLLVSTGGRSLQGKPMAITVRPRTLKAVARQPGPMTTLIETYST
jgi:hypothetical protein